MRVLFVAYQEASNPLMMYSQGFPYLTGLKKKGVEFSLFTFETEKSIQQSKELLEKNSWLKWYFVYFSRSSKILTSFLDIHRGTLEIFKILLKDNIEIVHARGLISAMISFLPVKVKRRKLFFDTRGLLADKYASGQIIKKNGLVYKIMKTLERFLLKRSDFFTLETNAHSRIIEKEFPELSTKRDVIPCCIDLDFFKYNNKVNKNLTFVYLGKIGTWHKVPEMFNFFTTASKKFKENHFLFLTTDSLEDIAKIVMKREMDKNNIKILNPRRSEIPSLLGEASAGILFINPFHGYNSSHIKFGEYLACGLPVIVNRGIGDTDLIIERQRVGVVIDTFSTSEYERALVELDKLLTEGEILRKRCREVAEKYFSLESGVEKYWSAYQKLAKR